MSKRFLCVFMSLVLCIGLAPLPAFADPEGGLLAAGLTAQDGEDVRMVVAEATSADVSENKGNVSPGGKDWSGSMWSYGVYARAENGWTATVNVKDVSVTTVNDYLWGVDAVASGNTPSHVTVTTGSVTARDLGVKAGADGNSDTTVTVNGNVAAEEGVLASSDRDATANAVVNGNVVAGERGIVVRSVASASPAWKATATVKVLGDVTATGSQGVGVSYDRKASKQDVLVTGTIRGAKYGVWADLAYQDLPEITSENGLTVWKVTTATGNAGDLFVKNVYNDKWQQEEVVDDDAAKAANYIVRCAKNVTPLKADGTALDTSHGYPVAHEGDRVLVTASNGNVVKKAYNDGVEVTTKDASGNFYVEVPRGGGIDLTAEVGDEPAPKMATVPTGAELTYTGKEQVGVAAGVGYTLSGTVAATEVGSYKATATLADGYTWSDDTAEAKEVGWKITHADTSKFTDLDANAWYMGAANGAFPGTETLYLDEALARGLMSGYKGTSNFGPNDAMSRAMVATVIYRMATGATADEPYATENTSGLSDVEPNQWYTAAVNWCVEHEVITGYEGGPDAGKFCPGKNTSREELATITGRYCTKVAGKPSAGSDVSRFSDAKQISDFAKEGVAYCVANKIVGGYTDGTNRFDPQGNALRCQGAKIFAVTARMLE